MSILSSSNSIYSSSSSSTLGYNVNSQITESDGSISSPLFEAINKKDKKLTALLLKEGADANTPRLDRSASSMSTPLYAAIQQRDPDLVDLLLKAGAEPNDGHIQVNFGFNFTETPLYLAIIQNDPKLVELLLQAGAKPNVTARKQEPEIPDDDKLMVDETPLHAAVNSHNDEIIALLLRYGADPNQKSCIGKINFFETPLYNAIFSREPERCIRLLVLAGADPFLPTGKFQMTPMDLAIERDNRSLIALLLTTVPPSKINVQELIEKSNATAPTRVSLHAKNQQFTEFDDVLTIPHEKVTIKTRWISSLHEIAKECIDAIYAASNPFVTPIAGFLDKSIKEKHPRVLRFLPENNGISELGYFDRRTKDIVLRVFDKGDINASIKKGDISADTFFSTYVHENYHAMLDATGLDEDVHFLERARLAAKTDIDALKKNNWPCNRVIEEHLRTVELAYSTNMQLEEYLVRLPQMIVEIQQKHKRTWQEAAALVKQAIPTLYKLVEEEVLPRFNAFSK